ncbi:hypothetical protein BJX61DRAFT_539632 [Aspergillus egyptiacus]|nr:hypothetical protein BJX61DRAFT_539632 [Aspergillus egyptiacus]
MNENAGSSELRRSARIQALEHWKNGDLLATREMLTTNSTQTRNGAASSPILTRTRASSTNIRINVTSRHAQGGKTRRDAHGQAQTQTKRNASSLPSSSNAADGRARNGKGIKLRTESKSGQVKGKEIKAKTKAGPIFSSSVAVHKSTPDTTSNQPKAKTRKPASSSEPHAAHSTASSSETKECVACLDKLPLSSFSQRPVTEGCEHPASQICKPCLHSSLQAQLDELSENGFTCPLCKHPMSDREARKLTTPGVFRRYDTLRKQRALANDPKFIRCSNPKCDGGQVHTSGAKSPMMTCRECGSRTCFNHQRPWHENMTCREYDRQEAVKARLREERRGEAARWRL